MRLSHYSPNNHFILYFRHLDWYFALFSACGIFCSCLEDPLSISVNINKLIWEKTVRSDYRTRGREKQIRRYNRNMLTLISLYSSWKDFPYKKRLRDQGLFCLEKTEGILSMLLYIYLTVGSQVDGDRLFSEVPSKRTRGNRHKLEHMKFHLNMRNNSFTVRVTEDMEQAAQKGCAVSSGDIQNTHEHFPMKPTVGNCLSRSYFHPLWFSDSI